MAGGVDVHKGPLTVRKSVGEAIRPGMVSIEYHVESKATTPISFQLVEVFPADLSADSIGFHSDYNADGWNVHPDDHRLRFEATIEPGETLETRLGVSVESEAELKPYLEPPQLDYRPNEQVADHSNDNRSELSLAELFGREWRSNGSPNRDRPPVGQPAAGDQASLGLSREFTAGDGGPGPAERKTNEGTSDQDTDAVDGPGTTAPEAPASDERSLVSALVAELQQGDIDEEELAVLRDALGAETPESTRIRVRYLQSQLGDLMTYADEFEELINREGRPTEIVANVRQAINDLDTRLATVDETVDGVAAGHGDIDDRLTQVEAELDRVDQLGDSLHRVRNELSKIAANQDTDTKRLESRLKELESAIEGHTASIEAEVRELRDKVDKNSTWRQRVQNTFENLSDESRLVR